MVSQLSTIEILVNHLATITLVVNFLLHFLHFLSRTFPLASLRYPFQVVCVLLQCGHLYGLAISYHLGAFKIPPYINTFRPGGPYRVLCKIERISIQASSLFFRLLHMTCTAQKKSRVINHPAFIIWYFLSSSLLISYYMLSLIYLLAIQICDDQDCIWTV